MKKSLPRVLQSGVNVPQVLCKMMHPLRMGEQYKEFCQYLSTEFNARVDTLTSLSLHSGVHKSGIVFSTLCKEWDSPRTEEWTTGPVFIS